MGQRYQFRRRIKWTCAGKKMVREMKEVGLQSCKPVLDLRSKAEGLGKMPMQNSSNQDKQLPLHLQGVLPRTPKIRSVVVVLDESGAGPSRPLQQSVPQVVTEPYVALNEEDGVLLEDAVINDVEAVTDDEDCMMTDDASELHGMALEGDNEPEDKIATEAFITDEWEEWMPMFYPLYEEPSFPLAELPTETILYMCEGLAPKEQVHFLSSVSSVARRPAIRLKLFQLKEFIVSYRIFWENGLTIFVGSSLGRLTVIFRLEKTGLTVRIGTMFSLTETRGLNEWPLMTLLGYGVYMGRN